MIPTTAHRAHRTGCLRSGPKSGRLMRVSRAVAFAMVVIAVMWAATPTVACFLPMNTMTAAERECCQKMANQCGSTTMSSSHSCCQTSHQRQSAISPVLTYSPTRHFDVAVIPQIAGAVIHSASISRQLPTLEAPPPEPSPGGRLVLRI